MKEAVKVVENVKQEVEVSLVDIGYGYLKFIDNSEKVQKTKSVVAERGDSLNGQDAKAVDIITVDGVDYIVGEGVYNLNKQPIVANENVGRADNPAYKVLGLYAVAKTHPSGGKIVMFTGLPFQNMDEADQVKDLFKGTHDVVLNKKKIKLEIAAVLVSSQGLGTWYSLVKQRGAAILKKKSLLVDIGFRTVNYLPISFGDIDEDRVQTARELGIQNAYSNIAAHINKEFKTNYAFHDVDDLLDNGVPRQNPELGKYREKIADKKYVVDELTKYAKSLWSDILIKYNDEFRESLDEIVFAGGSSDRVQQYLDMHRKQFCTFMENPQDVQVEGYGIIASKIVSASSSL